MARSRSPSYTPTEPDQSYAPTELDSAPMELDSNSELDSFDSLLDAAQRSPCDTSALSTQGSPCSTSRSNSYDSELAVDLAPEPAGLPAPVATLHFTPAHWSLQQCFRQDVDSALHACTNQHWFANLINWEHLSDFKSSLEFAIDAIAQNAHNWYKFKIGITENVSRRWHDSKMGYKNATEVCWEYLAVLYTAPTSKCKINAWDSDEVASLKRASTGLMETLLIKNFSELPNCLNKAAGGDCPSDGSPHFCYVAVAFNAV